MWKFIPCTEAQLNLKLVLANGQAFRWRMQQTDSHDIWVGVLSKALWLLRQDDSGIYYQTIFKQNIKSSDGVQPIPCKKDLDKETNNNEMFLRNYFQLDVDVENMYQHWSEGDKNFNKLQTQFNGIRILRQDPVENLFSYICSQNNNIIRISQLVEKLCENYGETVAEYDNVTYYAFPSVASLAKNGIEEALRKLSFGYRAKFIYQTAKCIEEKYGGENWVYSLREKSYEEAHKDLCSLPGIGAKVADCICLMSLDKAEAIPVDTHVWQIAVRDYLPHLKKYKTVTDKTYKEIGTFFRELYGEYAGWALSVLFSADLKKFKELKDSAESKTSHPKRKIEGKRTVQDKKKKIT